MFSVAALYRFVQIDDVPALCADLKALGVRYGLCGSLLIAPEGVNGTIAAQDSDLGAFMDQLNARIGIAQGEVKYSTALDQPFRRFKVKRKREIVTLRQPHVDPTRQVGIYVDARDWNNLIDDPAVTVIDTRNRYETKIGMFDRALDPDTETFTEFVDYVRTHLDPARHTKIAMYCTGGIRCEKASSFLLAEGFSTVYHLKGGILKYLETIPKDQSRWQGSCFVFDRRVAVTHGLATSAHIQCWGCGYPLDAADRAHVHFEDGVSCAQCIDKTTPAQKESFRARHHQMMRDTACL